MRLLPASVVSMTLEADLYRLKIRFEKLFADPRIFDDPRTFVRDFLASTGLSPGKVSEIYETTEDVDPVDDRGRPCVPAGTGKFRYGGRMLRSEYMQGANFRLEYVDFGSGLRREDHERMWKRGRWEDTSIETRDFYHQHVDTGVADISQLYTMLKDRATPTTMATVELPGATGSVFSATVKYVQDRLEQMVAKDGGTVEVYAARDLDSEENKALERRLSRESTGSTVYIILSIGQVSLELNR